jgi:hypothetical protein
MKKTATLEQIREYRKMLDNLSYDDNMDKVNSFMEEYDTMCSLFEENGCVGVKDILGEVLVPAMFDDITVVFSDVNRYFALPVIKNGKYGLVKPDGKGTMAAGCIYDNIHFEGGCHYLAKDGKQGMYDAYGNEVVPVMVDKVFEPWNDLIVFESDGKFGFAMFGSGVVTKAEYDAYEMDANEDLVVTLNGKKGYLDEAGKFTEDTDEAWFNARPE